MKNKKIWLFSIISLLTLASCDALLLEKKDNANKSPSPSVSSTPAPSTSPASTVQEDAPKVVDITDFMQKYSSISKPEDLVKIFLDNIFGYLDPAKKDKSAAIIAVLINAPTWETQAGSLSFFRTKLKDMPYIFRSYAKGSSPENNYQMNPDNYEIEITKSEKVDDATQKVFIKSSGADYPRPVTLKKTKEGFWIVHEFSSLYVDVRKP
ncbi:MAG: hypothetical protein U0457_00270 [Candidatus Sericytochromatia bacterium]